ncbi:MAG: hypothetical protein IBJ01_07640 [Leptospira sp.]|uniref:LIC_11883 family protein n=1 Tax=Leptospira sp. TaxID=178 RepID=UPI0025BA4DBA|nr:hypothetical protein [Leptospira sp.]MBL0954620.1 hypothetical protein [Leptospira sp.]
MKFKFTFLLAITVLLGAVHASETKIKQIPKQKTAKVLKSLAYATIRSTVMVTHTKFDEREVTYQTCSDDFPNMPGDFPCNFLDVTGTTDQVETESEVSDAEFAMGRDPEDMNPSGKIHIKVSKEKSRNLNGTVIYLGEGENKLSLFYSPKGQISHYLYQKMIVIFVWKKTEDSPSLAQIYFVKVNDEFFPEEVKEFTF